jgi:hypothetical protein
MIMNKEQFKELVYVYTSVARAYMTMMCTVGEDVFDNTSLKVNLDTMSEEIDNMYNKVETMLVEEIENLFGISDDDFVGDGFFQLLLDIQNGDLTADQLIYFFENNDFHQQRKWVIDYNLELIEEYYEKMKNFVDLDESSKIYNARIAVILDKARVPEEDRKRYEDMLHGFADGSVSRKEVINAFGFYYNR